MAKVPKIDGKELGGWEFQTQIKIMLNLKCDLFG